MTYIQIENNKFFYDLQGQGEPLVLIAGFACDHTFWKNIDADLCKNYQVCVFDNRAVGQTIDRPMPLTLDIMAEDTIKIIRALKLERPTILGQSMGGAIAQIVAHRYPDEINKLILLNTSAKINLRSLKALDSLVNLVKEQASFDAVVDASMPWFFSSDFLSQPKQITAYKDSIKNNPYLPSLENQQRQLKALFQFDATAQMVNIKASTLVIASEEDIICLPSESRELANKISGAQFRSIKGGHCSPIENPKVLLESLLEFLR